MATLYVCVCVLCNVQHQNNLCVQHSSSSTEVCVRFPQWPPGGAHPRLSSVWVCGRTRLRLLSLNFSDPLTELSALPTWLDNSWLEGEGREVREDTKGQQQEREQARGAGGKGGGGGGFG